MPRYTYTVRTCVCTRAHPKSKFFCFNANVYIVQLRLHCLTKQGRLYNTSKMYYPTSWSYKYDYCCKQKHIYKTNNIITTPWNQSSSFLPINVLIFCFPHFFVFDFWYYCRIIREVVPSLSDWDLAVGKSQQKKRKNRTQNSAQASKRASEQARSKRKTNDQRLDYKT